AVCLESIRSSDGKRRGFISWRVNGAIDFLAISIFAVVAGSRKYHDTRINQAPNGPAKRIILVRFNGLSTETQIDDSNVVVASVGCHPVEAVQNAFDRSRTFAVQDANVEQ